MDFRFVRHWQPALALALALSSPWAAFGQPAPAAQAAVPASAVYTIDPVHSAAKFDIDHLYVSTVSGQFNGDQGVKGTITLVSTDPAKSSVDVVIDAGTINTGFAARDNDLKSKRFFDVAQFPTITFKSSAVKPAGQGQLEVSGTLTMHGVARPVVIPVTQRGPAPGGKPGTLVVGFKGSLKLKRSDYGITTMMGPVGDDVAITLTIEAGASLPPQ